MKRYAVAACYGAFVIVLSLFPFGSWKMPDGNLFGWLFDRSSLFSKPDALANVLLYLPLGFLTASLHRDRYSPLVRFACAVIACILCSSVMETLQQFSAIRFSSIVDLLSNSCGAIIGSIASVYLMRGYRATELLQRLRRDHIESGRVYIIGLFAILLWVLSELSPFIPTLDPAEIKSSLKPLWKGLHDGLHLQPFETAVSTCNIAGLGMVAAVTARIKSRGLLLFLVMAGLVLLISSFIAGHQLTAEIVVGFAAGAVLAAVVLLLPRRPMLILSAFLIIVGFVCYQLQPGFSSWSVTNSFNWIPFRVQALKGLPGFKWVLSGIWPFVVLSFVAHLLFPERRPITLICGAVLLFVLAFALEWMQLYLPGRHPDITAVAHAIAAWSGPFFWSGKVKISTREIPDDMKLQVANG